MAIPFYITNLCQLWNVLFSTVFLLEMAGNDRQESQRLLLFVVGSWHYLRQR